MVADEARRLVRVSRIDQPEAALLPYETFRLLLDVAEDIVIAQRLQERLDGDDGRRVGLAELAAELGVDLDAL